MNICAIDIGLHGGICIHLDEDKIIADPLPIMPNGLSEGLDFMAMLYWYKNTRHFWHHLVIEKTQSMPKQGVVGVFNYGKLTGQIEGFFRTQGCEINWVRPRDWVDVMHEGLDRDIEPKDRSRMVMARDYEGFSLLASRRSRKMHEGMMDAFLIGKYWERQLKIKEDHATREPVTVGGGLAIAQIIRGGKR